MSIFDKFNQSIDVAGLKDDLKQVQEKNGGTDFEEVPFGTYIVKVEKMEIKECTSAAHKGEPLFSCWFKIAEGDQKNRYIFMNQLITQAFQIHIVNEFLRSLDSGLDVEFIDFGQYNDLILDIHETIDKKLEYELEYSQTSKGFNKFEITEVFDV